MSFITLPCFGACFSLKSANKPINDDNLIGPKRGNTGSALLATLSRQCPAPLGKQSAIAIGDHYQKSGAKRKQQAVNGSRLRKGP